MNHLAKEPKWTDAQKEVLNSNPNLIISGCVGSGKTLLACHLAMKYINDKSVLILVYTKALRTFILDYIYGFGEKNIKVLYEYEWRRHDFPDYDIIIIDEFQDFSLNGISTVIDKANDGVYIFGDDNQKVYSQNIWKETTTRKDEIIEATKFKHIHLAENFRISEGNKSFIDSLCKDSTLGKTFISTGVKPLIKYFNKVEDELKWIKEFIVNNNQYKSIGILLNKNDGFTLQYIKDNSVCENIVMGILELYTFLEEEGIECSYKFKGEDNLHFDKEFSINILTIHSSKGLQFDCVLLPFQCVFNDTSHANLLYVALTRAINQIIISYSGLSSKDYENLKDKSSYEGKLVKGSINALPTKEKIREIEFRNKLRKGGGHININDI